MTWLKTLDYCVREICNFILKERGTEVLNNMYIGQSKSLCTFYHNFFKPYIFFQIHSELFDSLSWFQ